MESEKLAHFQSELTFVVKRSPALPRVAPKAARILSSNTGERGLRANAKCGNFISIFSYFSTLKWTQRWMQQQTMLPKGTRNLMGVWQSSQPASFPPAGLTLWLNWLELWLMNLHYVNFAMRWGTASKRASRRWAIPKRDSSLSGHWMGHLLS